MRMYPMEVGLLQLDSLSIVLDVYIMLSNVKGKTFAHLIDVLFVSLSLKEVIYFTFSNDSVYTILVKLIMLALITHPKLSITG